VTVSIGLVETAGEDVSDLVNRADELLYHARKAGGNRVLEKQPENTSESQTLQDFLFQNRKV
jgi:hypothetical protein